MIRSILNILLWKGVITMSEKELVFEEVSENELFADYTADCSGGRSDCCTRVCTRNDYVSTEEAWGEFLNVEGGVIQY